MHHAVPLRKTDISSRFGRNHGKGMRAKIAIQEQSHEFIHSIPSVNCAPGGARVQHWPIGVERYRVTGLPESIDALILTSDLQGADRHDVSVLHRRLVGHVVAEHLEMLCHTETLPPAERCGVLLAGDLFAHLSLDKRGGLGDVIPVWKDFASRFKWVTGVAGNHDTFGGDTRSMASLHACDGCYGLDGGVVHLDSLCIGGVSGVVGSSGKPWKRAPKHFESMLHDVLDHGPDILVLHHSPQLVQGEELTGSELVADVLSHHATPLSFSVSGHVHWPSSLHIKEGKHQTLPLFNVDHRVVVLQREDLL